MFGIFKNEMAHGPALSGLQNAQVLAVIEHMTFKRFLTMRSDDRDFLLKNHPYKIYLLMNTAGDVINLSQCTSNEIFYDFVKANTFKTADKQSVIDLFDNDIDQLNKLYKANPDAYSIISHSHDPANERWVPQCK